MLVLSTLHQIIALDSAMDKHTLTIMTTLSDDDISNLHKYKFQKKKWYDAEMIWCWNYNKK